MVVGKQERIEAGLRERIRSGRYPLGSRIPPLWRVAADYGATEPTAQAAVRQLRREGLLVSCGRAGTFVPDALSDTADMRLMLDAAERGEMPPRLADQGDGRGAVLLVAFPAAYIRRLLAEVETLRVRLAAVESHHGHIQ